MVDLYQLGRTGYKGSMQAIKHIYHFLTDRAPKILVLVYHRVIPAVKFDILNNTVSPETFERQICTLAKKFPIISLTEVVKQCASGFAKSKTQVVLTFDDGYCDNYETVFPILQKKGLPATFFLITDYINGNGPLWDWQLINILNNNTSIRSIEIDNQIIQQGFLKSRLSFIFRVLDKMKSISFAKRHEILSFLKTKTNASFESNRCMAWQEVKKMSEAGMEIGSHSLSHRSLAMIPLLEAKEEIKKSKEIIEYNIKNPCYHFSFPYGSRQDYNQSLVNYVKDAGYQTCLLNVHGYNRIKKDSFCFKRIIMEEAINITHLLG